MRRHILCWITVFMLLGIEACSNSFFGSKGKKDEERATSSRPGVELQLSRTNKGFQIELICQSTQYGNESGTYVVFIPESSFGGAIRLTGIVDKVEVTSVVGKYDVFDPSQRCVKGLSLAIELVKARATGDPSGVIVAFAGVLTGIEPVISPSQLPGIALALGQRYVDVIGEANVRSEPFGYVLRVLSNGEPGLILVADMFYRINLDLVVDPETVGLDVSLAYRRSNPLPKVINMQQALSRIITGYEQYGKQISFPETVSASLSALKEPLSPQPGSITGEWEGTCRQYSFGINRSYPMLMKVEAMNGNTFSGTLHWPTLANSITSCEGTIKGNIVEWTEPNLLQGRSIVLNGTYKATLQGDSMTGMWYGPGSIKDDASFTLKRK